MKKDSDRNKVSEVGTGKLFIKYKIYLFFPVEKNIEVFIYIKNAQLSIKYTIHTSFCFIVIL